MYSAQWTLLEVLFWGGAIALGCVVLLLALICVRELWLAGAERRG